MLRFFIGFALVLTALCIVPNPVFAAGALAVGTDGNVAQSGIAYGDVVNSPTPEAAVDAALKACRSYQGAPKMAALCKIVATFTKECVSVALDPGQSTPGFGWGTGPDNVTAQNRAMAACQATAGINRQAFCKVDIIKCDTSN
jgi:hypothetical protein